MSDKSDTEQRSEQVFFEDPAVDRLMGVVLALATEHYVLLDRVHVLSAAWCRRAGSRCRGAAPPSTRMPRAGRGAVPSGYCVFKGTRRRRQIQPARTARREENPQ